MNLKHFLTSMAIIAALLLAGCGPSMTNLTSERVPQNASGIYTISMSVSNDNGSIIEDSIAPVVVIDGQKQPMQRSEIGKRIFDFDYVMPEGRNVAKYYFLLDYDVDYAGSASPRQITSGLYDLQLTNRYIITMESQRGPVGAEIPVVGRGFSNLDTFVVGGVQAETRFASPQAMSFIVPPMPSGEAYAVDLLSGGATIPIGYFQVDGSKLKVFPETLNLSPGERTVLTFGIDFSAPANGIPLKVLTDAPASIIIPEVVIPSGARTVSVPVQGGVAGEGRLVVSASGFTEIMVPFTVSGDVIPAAQQGAFMPEPAPALAPAATETSFNAAPAVGEDDMVIVEDIEVVEEIPSGS